KTKVIERKGGVFDEFSIISERILQIEDEKRAGKKISEITGYFDLVPILYSGKEDTSVLSEIKRFKYLDFTEFRVKHLEKGPVVSDFVVMKYSLLIDEISEKLKFVKTLKESRYKAIYKEYFKRLFLETKADWDNVRDADNNYISSLFVKTHAYNKIKEQTVYFA